MKLRNLIEKNTTAEGAAVISGTRASLNSKGELLIYGIIGDWWEGLDAETAVLQAEQAGSDGVLVVRIHSTGGNVVEGLAIFNALKRSEKEVHVYIDGIAASMASGVACAADKVFMPSNTLMMVHKPSSVFAGNADELRDAADQVEILEASYLDCYAQKGNLSVDELKSLISDGKDHWFTAEQCLEMGLCDEILAEPIAVAAEYSANDFHNPPADLWTGLVVKTKAAGAAKPLENKAMFKLRITALLAGGATLAEALSVALADKYKDVQEAVAGLSALNIADAKKVLTGEVEATEAVVTQLAAELGVDVPVPAVTDPVVPATATATDVATAAAAAVASERDRVSQIQALGAQYALPADNVTAFVSGGITVAEARSQALDILAARSAQNQPAPGVRVSYPQADAIRGAMAVAIGNRFDPAGHQLDDASMPFAHLSLIEMARAHLQMGGVDTTGMNSNAVATMAMQSSSDFPAILADVANNSMRAGYEAAPRTFTSIARRTSAADFKPINRSQLGSAGGSLNKVNEKGEFKHGQVVDGKESYALATYGEIIAITRKTLINDSLDALSRIPSLQGAQVSETESELVWNLIINNAKLSDNVALFHANHGNLGTGVIGETALNAARKAMRLQKKMDGKTPMNLAPAFMCVPAALETTAQKFLATVQADSAGNVNPFASSVDLLVEARLDANSELEWYQVADPNRIDTIEYAYLEGEEGAYMESRQGFDVDGLELKVRLDIGAGLIDYRGFYKSSGA